MTLEATAVYSNGVLHLTAPLPLAEQQMVHLRIDAETSQPPFKEPKDLTFEEFEAILNEMTEDVPRDAPPLPDDFSRADCYSDDRG